MIDMANNRANMAYVGKTPWHGLGEKINPDSTIEEWKIAAGLDWNIEKRPIAYGVSNADGDIVPRTIDKRFAHVRSDTQDYIGMGSDQFKILQPGDVLEFYRDLVQDSRFRIETAGSLKGGAKIWALAKCELSLTLGDDDIVNPYLLLATANDGTMSTAADFTSVRVVCNNTLSMAVGSNGQQARIRVPHSRQFDATDVKAELGLIDDTLEHFARDADKLTQTRIDDETAIKYFVNLYAKTDADGKVENEKTVNSVVNKLLNVYRRGPGSNLETARNTPWGLVNAVTNYVDFDTRAQSNGNRFESAQFGMNANLKKLAFDEALKIAA